MSFKTFLTSSSDILDAFRKASYISMYYFNNMSPISLFFLDIYSPQCKTSSDKVVKMKQRICPQRPYKFNLQIDH